MNKQFFHPKINFFENFKKSINLSMKIYIVFMSKISNQIYIHISWIYIDIFCIIFFWKTFLVRIYQTKVARIQSIVWNQEMPGRYETFIGIIESIWRWFESILSLEISTLKIIMMVLIWNICQISAEYGWYIFNIWCWNPEEIYQHIMNT